MTRKLAATLSFLGIPITLDATITEWWTTQYSAPVLIHQRGIVKSPVGVDTTYSATLLTAQTVGTQELEPNRIVRTFPNPASAGVSLDIDVPALSKVGAVIFSMNGQVLKTRNFGDLQAGKQQVSFDVSDLPAGSYHIVLMSDKGKLGSQKIVVAK